MDSRTCVLSVKKDLSSEFVRELNVDVASALLSPGDNIPDALKW